MNYNIHVLFIRAKIGSCDPITYYAWTVDVPIMVQCYQKNMGGRRRRLVSYYSTKTRNRFSTFFFTLSSSAYVVYTYNIMYTEGKLIVR